jgi:hypothetical protein
MAESIKLNLKNVVEGTLKTALNILGKLPTSAESMTDPKSWPKYEPEIREAIQLLEAMIYAAQSLYKLRR